MIKTVTMAKLFNVTPQAINKWRREKKPVLSLLEKYFQEEEINEFINNDTIEKMEIVSTIPKGELRYLSSQRIVSDDLLKVKLIQMPQAIKQIMLTQLEFCGDKNCNFTLDLALMTFSKDVVPLDDDSLFELYKAKYIYYLENVMTQKDINYINSHKQEIIEFLQMYNDGIVAGSW